MAHCLNPQCPNPELPGTSDSCQHCGASLLIQGRYRALSMIGSGGFGKTFKAQDEGKPSPPLCVIKQLFYNDAATQQKSIELFEQEAIYLENLEDHSQVPSLHWQGQQDGIHYIVQEYIDGQNLEQELKESGPFSEEKILQVLEELLPLLAQIHSVEVIHRDIKPENIIRRRNDRRLVLVDFGAVKVATQKALAQTGAKMSDSIEHLAPEQIRGRAMFASDLYGLGVTCLRLLTDQSPLDLYNDLEERWTWREHLSPGAQVSQRLGKILDRLVAISLNQRFKTAQEVLTALHASTLPPLPQSRSKPQQPTTHSPRPASSTPRQSASKRKTDQFDLGGITTRRAFVGLGVVTLGAVLARSLFSNRLALKTVDHPTNEACTRLDSLILDDTLVAGLPSESYSFTTVINVNASATQGDEVRSSVTRWIEDLGNGVLLYLVRIPAGSFIMGSPNGEVDRRDAEGPQHEVYVPECWMGQFTVTQAQYLAITGENPSSSQGDQNPVEKVNWDEAQDFCRKLRQYTGRNYHLPTEAIWEYACRACSTTPFHFGETIRPDLVNYDSKRPYRNARQGQYRQQVLPVGSLPPNLWGLHEMHGNVLEWCEDPLTDSYDWKHETHSARKNALNILPYKNQESVRVQRGGSWVSDANTCRSAYRDGMHRDLADLFGGFRVLLSSRTS